VPETAWTTQSNNCQGYWQPARLELVVVVVVVDDDVTDSTVPVCTYLTAVESSAVASIHSTAEADSTVERTS
jgi:hypothetical protein